MTPSETLMALLEQQQAHSRKVEEEAMDPSKGPVMMLYDGRPKVGVFPISDWFHCKEPGGIARLLVYAPDMCRVLAHESSDGGKSWDVADSISLTECPQCLEWTLKETTSSWRVALEMGRAGAVKVLGQRRLAVTLQEAASARG